VPALRHSSDGEPGYARRRAGRGWRYVDDRGRRLTDERVVRRIEGLVIPPAWRDVWICRSSRGHLQATGRDSAGRKQYRYHPRWREDRDHEKYERILRFAERLPEMRRVSRRHVRRRRVDRERALGTVVQLLDRTHLRIGSEEYVERNGTYGLATIRSRHVEADGDLLVLDFAGKGGKRQHAEVEDALLTRAVLEMDDLRGAEVFKWRDGDGEVHDLRPDDVNDYIRAHMGEEFTAKDFRTWAGTVAAAVALDEVGAPSGSRARQRAVAGVVRTVADLLGNTPAVCRASYIDPRVIDRFLDGVTISGLREAVEGAVGSERAAHELAVLALLRHGLEERMGARAGLPGSRGG
jgi:DNA topoisomerase I